MTTRIALTFGICCIALPCVLTPCLAQSADSPASTDMDSSVIDVSGMYAYDGFFDFFWDDEAGKIWLRLERFDEPFLYVNSLASGLGSFIKS